MGDDELTAAANELFLGHDEREKPVGLYGEDSQYGAPTMNDIEKKRVEHAVAAFVAARRPPEHLRDEVDLAFRFDGRYVEIFEIRPRWNKPSERIEEPVARARYFKSRNEWVVYWQRADLKWHKYAPAPEVKTIQAFLEIVDEDNYGCFFG